jgi:hypothetical protein
MASGDPDEAWRAAMRQLVRRAPGGPFAWRDGGLDAIGRSLAHALRGPQAADAVGGLLRLASALRRRLGSPAAADALVAVVKATPGARALARRLFGSGRAEAAQRRFREVTGAPRTLRAPTVPTPGRAAPGTPLRELIDPLERDRMRARAKK